MSIFDDLGPIAERLNDLERGVQGPAPRDVSWNADFRDPELGPAYAVRKDPDFPLPVYAYLANSLDERLGPIVHAVMLPAGNWTDMVARFVDDTGAFCRRATFRADPRLQRPPGDVSRLIFFWPGRGILFYQEARNPWNATDNEKLHFTITSIDPDPAPYVRP